LHAPIPSAIIPGTSARADGATGETTRPGPGALVLASSDVNMRRLRAGLGHCAQTAGAELERDADPIDDERSLLNVGIPVAVGMALRETYIVTKHLMLTTHFALRHGRTFLLCGRLKGDMSVFPARHCI